MKSPLLLLAGLALYPYHAAQATQAAVCEAGKGYIAADLSEPVREQTLRKLKDIGIETVIRYYDWVDETIKGKTITRPELNIIAKLQMNVAVVFQHHNDAIPTFLTEDNKDKSKRRGVIDFESSLGAGKKLSSAARNRDILRR